MGLSIDQLNMSMPPSSLPSTHQTWTIDTKQPSAHPNFTNICPNKCKQHIY